MGNEKQNVDAVIINIKKQGKSITHQLWRDLYAPDQRVCFPIIECESTNGPNTEQKATIDTYSIYTAP